MRVAARRSTRVGQRSGVPLEDLGVVPDEQHLMTRADVLKHNVDLIAHAAAILAKKPTQQLRLAPIGRPPVRKIRIESANVERVDVAVADRPVLSRDMKVTPLEVSLPRPVPVGTTIVAYGYRAGALVVCARHSVRQ
jgi:hypothetical protein